MYGAILGDMIGAPYEFDRGDKRKDFPLFGKGSMFTDDSVMTIAVAEALMDADGETDEKKIRQALVKSMQKWGHKYPHAGYGGRFRSWLHDKDPKPYGSFGNGSAMRVSAAGWLYDTIEETRKMARLSAEVTHNHPEGIKGAEATASAIFIARNGGSKEEIRDYIVSEFGYDLSRTCDQIRPTYHHVESCQETVPEAITAFLEGEDLEDVIRTAVSLGGDTDTLAAIAGSMAEAFFGVPDDLIHACRNRLDADLLKVLERFEAIRPERIPAFHDAFLDGNEVIEQAIDRYSNDPSGENLAGIVAAISKRMREDGHFAAPVEWRDNGSEFSLRLIQKGEEAASGLWVPLFTSEKELKKSPPSQILSNFIDFFMRMGLEMEEAGLVINPWGTPFAITKDLIQRIFAEAGVDPVMNRESTLDGG